MCVVLLVAIIATTRYVSIGTISTAAASPLLVVVAQRYGWVRNGDAWLPVAVAAIAAIVLVRHRPNVRRLRSGIEPKLGESRTALQPRSRNFS
jgi:glycerol-3-phosphate acyltransferase PlsY